MIIISLISAYELWFKQILFEMDIVRKLLDINLWVYILKYLFFIFTKQI